MQEVVSGGDAVAAEVAETVGTIIQTVDSDLLQLIADKLEVTNTLLLRLAERIDFFIAVVVLIVFIAVCYIILKSFTRF